MDERSAIDFPVEIGYNMLISRDEGGKQTIEGAYSIHQCDCGIVGLEARDNS
jgi:hypothetical protein